MSVATKIRTQFQDLFLWVETPDGKTIELNSGGSHLDSFSNLGGADLQNITQTGVNQHGATWQDFRALSRLMTFTVRQLDCGCYGHCNTLLTQTSSILACDPPQVVFCNGSPLTVSEIVGQVQPKQCGPEQSYLSSIAYFSNMMRPNRGGPMMLCASLPDATQKRIPARPDLQPQFVHDNSPKPDKYQTPFRLLGSKPFWEDYDLVTVTQDGLSGAFSERLSIRNCGTFETFPQIVINGPVIDPVIANITTGREIRLNYTVSTGETVTIELDSTDDNRPRKMVTSTVNGNLISTVNDAGAMAKFSLAPEMVGVDWGINTIQFNGSGADANTSIVLNYRQKYMGVIL